MKVAQYEDMLARPLPWQQGRLPQSVIDEEMQMFERAVAQKDNE